MSKHIKNTDTKSTDDNKVNIVGLDIFREKLIGSKTNDELVEIAKTSVHDGNIIPPEWIRGIVCAVTIMQNNLWKEISSSKGEKFTSRKLFCEEVLKIKTNTYHKSVRSLRAYIAIIEDSNLVKPTCFYQLEPLTTVKDPVKIREIWARASTGNGAPTNCTIAENVSSAPTAGMRRIPKGDVLKIFELVLEAQSHLSSDEPKKVASSLKRSIELISEFISKKKISEIKQKLSEKYSKAKDVIDKKNEDAATPINTPDNPDQCGKVSDGPKDNPEGQPSIIKYISLHGTNLVIQLPDDATAAKYSVDLKRIGFETLTGSRKCWRNVRDEAEADYIKSELCKLVA